MSVFNFFRSHKSSFRFVNILAFSLFIASCSAIVSADKATLPSKIKRTDGEALSKAEINQLLEDLFVYNYEQSSGAQFVIANFDNLEQLLEDDQVDFSLVVGRNLSAESLTFPTTNSANRFSSFLTHNQLSTRGFIMIEDSVYKASLNEMISELAPSFGGLGNLYSVKLFATHRESGEVLAQYSGTVEILGSKK